MTKKLNIIIPVYNGATYLARGLDAVLNQKNINNNDIELTLINDGSKDNSLEILNHYKNEYPDVVRLIDQQNMGAAKSRNKGIGLSSAEYTTFLDQDDYVDSDYIEKLLGAITVGDFDMVQSGFKLTNKSGKVIKTILPINTEFGRLLAIPAWAKIYRTTFLKENNITFFDNNIGEDSIFTIKAILSTKKYGTIQYAGYNNSFDNEESVTNTLHKGLSKTVNIEGLIDEMYGVKSTDARTQKLLEYNIIRTCAYYLLSYGKYATPARFKEEYRNLFGWLEKNIPSFGSNSFIWKKPKGEVLSASMGIKLLVILHGIRAVPLFAKFYSKGEQK